MEVPQSVEDEAKFPKKRGEPKMTNDQKRRLANALICEAANMVEEMYARNGYLDDIKDIDPAAAAIQLANWLQHLPGDSWDMRLPQPAQGEPEMNPKSMQQYLAETEVEAQQAELA
jgi:hypothetical protein